MTSKPKSWCDVLEIHPAAELFPMMSDDELQELGEDIKKHGLHEGVALCDGKLLDGRNRLDAMEMAGIKVVTSRKVMHHIERAIDSRLWPELTPKFHEELDKIIEETVAAKRKLAQAAE
jgi:hypothetical protein